VGMWGWQRCLCAAGERIAAQPANMAMHCQNAGLEGGMARLFAPQHLLALTLQMTPSPRRFSGTEEYIYR
jgi:hypothetical protein